MTVFFADTFYWAALTNPRDRYHARAVEFSSSLRPDKLFTTDEVLSEYLAFFSGTRESVRIKAGNYVARLLSDRRVVVFPQSRNSFLAGLDLYRARADKGYSLTDCVSMPTMRREGVTDILTNDHHFEQEGFRALFRNL